jgi:hypothetical protein
MGYEDLRPASLHREELVDAQRPPAGPRKERRDVLLHRVPEAAADDLKKEAVGGLTISVCGPILPACGKNEAEER